MDQRNRRTRKKIRCSRLPRRYPRGDSQSTLRGTFAPGYKARVRLRTTDGYFMGKAKPLLNGNSGSGKENVLQWYFTTIERKSQVELIVDNFAGGGGASTGIEMATGRSVDIAINHDPDAITMHRVNHPHTRHYWFQSPRGEGVVQTFSP